MAGPVLVRRLLLCVVVVVVAVVVVGCDTCFAGNTPKSPDHDHHHHHQQQRQQQRQQHDRQQDQKLPWITASGEDALLRDEQGRVRVFHGVNHVQKAFPWYPPILLNTTYIKEMASLGVNVVRLGFMWSGAEPSEGNFNMTYYQTIDTIVAQLANHNIYTLLDVHQDGFSSKFCLYDGIPLWVANRSVARRPFPWPMQGGCSSRPWAANELTEACGQAYDDLYHNVRGMRDAFIKFWSFSADYFKNNSNIIGYELINEPFAGDVYAKPELFLPGVAGRENLALLYDAVAPAIRQRDQRHLIFYEPVTWGMVFNGSVVGSGFQHVPGGAAHANKSVFSFHYYCWFFDIPGNASTWRRAACDDALGPQVFNAVQRDVGYLGGASFLTEFAATTCDPSSGASEECTAVLDLCDEHLVSWIHWPTDTDYPGGVYDWAAYAALGLSRPYAAAVAGLVQSVSFNNATRTFHMCMQFTALTPSAKTVVRYDKTHMYASGVYIRPSGGLSIATVSDHDVVLISQQTQGSGCVTLSPPPDNAPDTAVAAATTGTTGTRTGGKGAA
ncbi:hypothetical protein PTSG_04956 [Salpingoeca rosetta]|uniref:Endoglycoceramidase n=1 Tax=Salpingoeca rosetta (strain ATCC 50818 / BSB-021) TaxID=946362 RepID=F2U937_SALR5|nr:uncharacterized protein PTSG_04956 [Salpingoeca rosetta]EGD73240.1 hypothetical protein PTSG_04956 [Salpingoeca rosetta]|eukprot:XP_004994271.1 hypothetical protein PTSG_04956 [Salpingoeca rosetta]